MIKNIKLLKVREIEREGRITSYNGDVHSSKGMRALAKWMPGKFGLQSVTKANSDVRHEGIGLDRHLEEG